MILGVETLGSIVGYPEEHRPRNGRFNQTFDRKLADGTHAPAGNLHDLGFVLYGYSAIAQWPVNYDEQETVPFSIEYI